MLNAFRVALVQPVIGADIETIGRVGECRDVAPGRRDVLHDKRPIALSGAREPA